VVYLLRVYPTVTTVYHGFDPLTGLTRALKHPILSGQFSTTRHRYCPAAPPRLLPTAATTTVVPRRRWTAGRALLRSPQTTTHSPKYVFPETHRSELGFMNQTTRNQKPSWEMGDFYLPRHSSGREEVGPPSENGSEA
jgi:hypothetical protein